MDSDYWPAPAKLNLTLRIVGRRPDGYHLLQTVFQFLDWEDRLWFDVLNEDVVSTDHRVPGMDTEQDLVVRAARLLKAHTGFDRGVHIRVQKNLPSGGGLGGGSSDAATTLAALNRLWGLGLDDTSLIELGLGLGADVPVFLRGHAAWAEGVGERLAEVDPPELWYVLLSPPVHVSTGAVFAHPELTRDSPITTIADFLAGRHQNDCAALVRREYPEIDHAMAWLGRHGESRLTGTGACVFAGFGERAAAEAVARQAPKVWNARAVRGQNVSPLRARLARG